MKPVQVMMDERLLAALDEDPDVRAAGRSVAIRAAVEAWLRAKRKRATDDAYRHGYAASPGLSGEWADWSEEGEWPGE